MVVTAYKLPRETTKLPIDYSPEQHTVADPT